MADAHEAPSLLHVGFPKTGTTALQNDLFCNEACGLGLPAGSQSRACLVDWFTTSDGYLFDPKVVTEEMAEHEAPLRARGLLPVWSDETLAGNPLQRRYDGPETLNRISALNRPFRVLFTIREQRAMALSLYREFVKSGGAHGLTDFIGTGYEPRSFTPILRADYLFYDRAVSAWSAQLGSENVLVLPYELFAADPAAFFNRLATFLGIDLEDPSLPSRHNVGTGALALDLRRRLNRFFVHTPLSQHRSLPDRAAQRMIRLIDRFCPSKLNAWAETRLRAQIFDRYRDVFTDSNRRLEALMGIDLREMGYQ